MTALDRRAFGRLLVGSLSLPSLDARMRAANLRSDTDAPSILLFLSDDLGYGDLACYATCFVGKWHVSRLGQAAQGQPSPGDFGFDHWFATEHNSFEGPRNPRHFIRNGVAVGPTDGWYCDLIVQEALEWLARRRDKTRPFFIYACSHEPHTPVAPPPEYARMYDTPEVARLGKGMVYGGVDRPDRDLSDHRKHYYGTVTQLDTAFGRLTDGAKGAAPGRLAVFFTSDNGPEYPVNWIESRDRFADPLRDFSHGTPGPLRGMKRYTYEGGHRVPLIVSYPRPFCRKCGWAFGRKRPSGRIGIGAEPERAQPDRRTLVAPHVDSTPSAHRGACADSPDRRIASGHRTSPDSESRTSAQADHRRGRVSPGARPDRVAQALSRDAAQ